ncbi:hypothetical protein [Vogesella sp. XCS3]|uniref:hypothetical protein n=1 Tax=Vogesella sp. XCS3 TaxID=2877939 RepID=UPI001D0AEB4F|nr:hypothetical protein [Vogesella sp. XCS3]UDM17939.1 hypothetical protein LCH97_04550 [Vogesella sp. XCS3]
MGTLIPASYRWLAMLALAAAVFATGWVKGASQVQARWDAATGIQTVAVATVRQRQAEATVQVVTQYVDRVHTVREVGQTIIKEVPVYVPADSPALPGGFRLLHDAAVRGELPDATGVADAPPVPAQDLAATVAANYLTCRENAEQLTALQAWIELQSRQ